MFPWRIEQWCFWLRRPMKSKQYGGVGSLKLEPTWGCACPKIKLIIPKLLYSLSAHCWDCCQEIFDVWEKKTATVNCRLSMGVFPLGHHSRSCTQACHSWSPGLNRSSKGYNISVSVSPWLHYKVSSLDLPLSIRLSKCPSAFLSSPITHKYCKKRNCKIHKISLSWCMPYALYV